MQSTVYCFLRNTVSAREDAVAARAGDYRSSFRPRTHAEPADAPRRRKKPPPSWFPGMREGIRAGGSSLLFPGSKGRGHGFISLPWHERTESCRPPQGGRRSRARPAGIQAAAGVHAAFMRRCRTPLERAIGIYRRGTGEVAPKEKNCLAQRDRPGGKAAAAERLPENPAFFGNPPILPHPSCWKVRQDVPAFFPRGSVRYK